MTVGRIDSRFTGGSRTGSRKRPRTSRRERRRPAIVATFNDYARRELGVVSDRSTSCRRGSTRSGISATCRRIERPENAVHERAARISYAMAMNPKMKVLVQQGYFDLACPYGTVKHAIDHLNVTPKLRRTSHRVLRSRSHDVRASGLDAEVRRHDQGVHRRERELKPRDFCSESGLSRTPAGRQRVYRFAP